MDLKENEIIVNDVLVNIDDLDEWYISSACGQQHDDDTLIYCHNIFNGSGDCVGVVFFRGSKKYESDNQDWSDYSKYYV